MGASSSTVIAPLGSRGTAPRPDRGGPARYALGVNPRRVPGRDRARAAQVVPRRAAGGLRHAFVAVGAAAVALASAAWVGDPCLCLDDDVCPHRYGLDGRSSASLIRSGRLRYKVPSRGGVSAATKEES